jgi:hypothetical protein
MVQFGVCILRLKNRTELDFGCTRKKGAKEDFFIPKLKLLQSFRGMIERLGTLM